MQIIYRADDGTDFRSEEECEAYENKKKIAAMHLQSRFFRSELLPRGRIRGLRTCGNGGKHS